MESLGLGLGFVGGCDACCLQLDAQKEQGPELLRSGPVVLLHYLKRGGWNI